MYVLFVSSTQTTNNQSAFPRKSSITKPWFIIFMFFPNYNLYSHSNNVLNMTEIAE